LIVISKLNIAYTTLRYNAWLIATISYPGFVSEIQDTEDAWMCVYLCVMVVVRYTRVYPPQEILTGRALGIAARRLARISRPTQKHSLVSDL